MRINVYGEEILFDTKVVTKKVDGKTFYGIRMFLASSEKLHFTPKDDDRSAITFWVPWTKKKGNDHNLMCQFMELLLGQAITAMRMERNQHHLNFLNKQKNNKGK